MRELRTVLIVEDNRISRVILSEIVHGFGVEVFEAADGAQAIASIEAEAPDLVISDILMPHCDGFNLAEHIQSSTACHSTVLFLITAVYKTNMWKQETLRNQRVHEYLTKPVDPQDLELAIRRHFTLPD